jgi:citronellol/citronellal dehydrogenase
MPPSEVFAPDLLAGRSALVTGGGTGLGKAAAAELVACGCRVLVAGRRAEVVEAAADELGCEWAAGDVRSPEGAARLVETALERFARLDILVNNAGGQYFAPAEAIEAKGWRAVMALNVGGILEMSEAAYARAFRRVGRGTIVNVTLSPHHGLPGMAHSSAARAAVENLTRVLSIEWARFGIRLTALAAGHFATETLRTKYPQQVVDGVAGTVPLGRLGTEEEFAWLVAYLASPAGDYLSGAILTIDGARDNWLGSWPPGGLTDDAGKPLAEERKPSS